MQLKVPFSEIPEHGLTCEINDSLWFPDELFDQSGSGTVHVRLTKKNDTAITLEGQLKLGLTLECDRCLDRYGFQVDSPMQLLIEVVEEERWRLQDIEPAEVELERIIQKEPVVDLPELLRQQLILAVPEKKLCRKKCLGLCLQCGTNLNMEKKCKCTAQVVNSPFAVLETLKKK